MKKLYLYTVFFFCAVFGYAQNLVPNPSFEIYSTCPNNDNQVDFATGWSGCSNTPDYFNSCNTIVPDFSVPNNWGGYQQPATGNAYCGIGTYASYSPDAREFIISQLNTPLTIGTKYFASFMTNLSLYNTTYFNTASNKIGMLFSTVPYDAFNWAPVNNGSQIYTNSIITDTANWVIVGGSFVADSAYKYVIIGNFFTDVNTDTLIYNFDTSCSSSSCQTAYYFVDDVYVGTDSLVSVVPTFSVKENISVFPNPTKDFINIVYKSNSSEPIEIYLIDSFGRTVLVDKMINQKKIDIENIEAGFYTLLIKHKGTNSYKRILKQ